jgi:hypothetical protein
MGSLIATSANQSANPTPSARRTMASAIVHPDPSQSRGTAAHPKQADPDPQGSISPQFVFHDRPPMMLLWLVAHVGIKFARTVACFQKLALAVRAVTNGETVDGRSNSGLSHSGRPRRGLPWPKRNSRTLPQLLPVPFGKNTKPLK